MSRLEHPAYIGVEYVDGMPREYWLEILYHLVADVEFLVRALEPRLPPAVYEHWMQRLHLARKALDALSREDGR